MTVQFLAALQGAACLKFDSDGEGTVKLTVPADQLPQVAKLLAYREQVLMVTIEPQREAR